MTSTRARRPGPSVRTRVTELRDGRRLDREDRLATEEPLEIRIEAPGLPAQRVAVTMRTPGHDFELAAGWLVHERVVRPADIAAVRYCTDERLSDLEEFNVVTVELIGPPLALPTARLIGSACGVCGTDSVHDLVADGHRRQDAVEIPREILLGLPDRLRDRQPGFERTGGLHAAGLTGADGDVVVVREDVGRHNAVDKVVGAQLLAGEPVPAVLVLSGRIGFELVQKAVVSGIGVVAAVGAPSSLARALAEQAGIVLAGFVREGRCVVYTGADQVL